MGSRAHKLGLAEFLEWENAQTERHEYTRGEVLAMVGGRRRRDPLPGRLRDLRPRRPRDRDGVPLTDVVIEVLSATTQAYDRSLKFALYRRLASLREYVVVDPDTRRVEAFRRNDAGEWVLHDMSDDDALELPTIGVPVRQGDLFDGLEPPGEAPPA